MLKSAMNMKVLGQFGEGHRALIIVESTPNLEQSIEEQVETAVDLARLLLVTVPAPILFAANKVMQEHMDAILIAEEFFPMGVRDVILNSPEHASTALEFYHEQKQIVEENVMSIEDMHLFYKRFDKFFEEVMIPSDTIGSA